MAFPVDYSKEPEESAKEKLVMSVQHAKNSIVNRTVDASISLGNFIMQYTAVFFYYLFAGLSVLFRGKVPKGWERPTKEHVDMVAHNLDNFMMKRDRRKYGRVVDLDDATPRIDLLKH